MAKVLTIIPYKFYPPTNGGALRCFHILREMSRQHELYLLTVQPVDDFFGNINADFPINVTVISLFSTIPYRSFFNFFPNKIADAINSRLINKKFRASANSYFLKAYPVLLKMLNEIQPDIVYFENLEAVGFFSKIVRNQIPAAKQIYDSHNIDSELWKQIAKSKNNLDFRKYSIGALLLETQLNRMVDYFFCCSETDKRKLLLLNSDKIQGWMIPNGVDTLKKNFDSNPLKYINNTILFCGSLEYLPNMEGLYWFYTKVFPLIKRVIPNIVLMIIGTDLHENNYEEFRCDNSVKFIGKVVDLKAFYYATSLSIAPILSGRGTRLKILEAMSFGNPVVSTSIGAEGIEVIAGEHLMIANEPEDFANKVVELLQNNDLFESIRQKSRELVQSEYDWGKIGIKINSILHQI